MTSSCSVVLCSAGLDSVVLAAFEARRSGVRLVYVSAGLAWEAEELRALDRLLARPPLAALGPVACLDVTVRDVYPPSHWALRGEPPGFDTPDEDVYLIGRNIVLLGKTAVYCARHGIGRIVIGPLAGNPFPDATPEFFGAMSRALTLGLDHPIAIDAPFADRTKADVIRLGIELGVPLELTLSCMNPQHGVHCGHCSKCRERQQAFAAAGVPDSTRYVRNA